MHSGLLITSQIFGLIPLNYMDRKRHFYDYTFMFLVPCFYIFSYLMANFQMYSVKNLPTCGNICTLGGTILINLGIFVYLTNYTLSLFRGKYFFPEFYKQLHAIDEILSKCQRNVRTKRKSFNLLRKLKLFIFFFLVFLAVSYEIVRHKQFLGKGAVLASMTVSFPYLASGLVQAQFSYLVTIISERFKKLNFILECLNRECSKKNLPIKIFDIESDELKKKKKKSQPMNFQIEKFNDFKKVSDSENDDNTTEAEEDEEEDEEMEQEANNEYPDIECKNSEEFLVDLFGSHEKILTLSRLTNHEYGAQAVPYMVVCFITVIYAIFMHTKVHAVVSGISKVLDFIATLYLLWGIVTLIVAYVVLRLCCNANGFSKKSAMIVHEIMQKKPQFMMGNDLYYNKMKSFTLQFLHWEGFFQFNGIGMFALDYTFIFSTVSAATSYLIVVLQFDMTTILKNDGLMV